MTNQVVADRKQAMKAIRKERSSLVETAQARLKDQIRIRKLLAEALKNGPATVPEISAVTGVATELVLWHVIAMKKYGKMIEVDQDGDYYRYQLAEK